MIEFGVFLVLFDPDLARLFIRTQKNHIVFLSNQDVRRRMRYI